MEAFFPEEGSIARRDITFYRDEDINGAPPLENVRSIFYLLSDARYARAPKSVASATAKRERERKELSVFSCRGEISQGAANDRTELFSCRTEERCIHMRTSVTYVKRAEECVVKPMMMMMMMMIRCFVKFISRQFTSRHFHCEKRE